MQMIWIIFIHVIIEVIDISLTLKVCLRRKVHFSPFFILYKGALTWYGKLTWESVHSWYDFYIYGAFEFLCNSIANL